MAFFFAHVVPRLLAAALYSWAAVCAARFVARRGRLARRVRFAVYGGFAAAHFALPYWLFYPVSREWRYRPVGFATACGVAALAVTTAWLLWRAWGLWRALPRTRPEPRPRGGPAPAVDRARREFLADGARLASAALCGGGIGYGYLTRRDIQITRVSLSLPWPKSMRGMKIVQLSDFHVESEADLGYVRQIVALSNAERPEMLLLTGDYTSQTGPLLDRLSEELDKLKAGFARFAVLGNHDYYSDYRQAEIALGRARFPVLRNTTTQLLIENGPIQLIGVPDAYAPRFGGDGPDLGKALRGAKLTGLTVLIAHQPAIFDQAAELGVHLTLCGHTHGGQIALGKAINPARPLTPYTYGLFKRGNSQLYVTSGLGTVGVPVRLGVPPEIAVFTVEC